MWDCNEKLLYGSFSLEDCARTWLENREAMLTTWDLFHAAFLDTFTSVVRKERAETLLESYVQLPNENIRMYTGKITCLFHHADPAMSEKKEGSLPHAVSVV